MSKMPKKDKYKPNEMVYFTAVWRLPFFETKELILKVGRAEYYYYNTGWNERIVLKDKRITVRWC